MEDRNQLRPAIWFPCVRANSGTDVFTQSLVDALVGNGIRAEICWLPHRAEYLPWSVPAPVPPDWVNIVHVNSWMHSRFIPENIPTVVTIHNCVHSPEYQKYKTFLQCLYHEYWIKPIEKRAVVNADIVTAVSIDTASNARKELHCEKILPVVNWADTDFFTPISRSEPSVPFRLLFAGQASNRKGVDLLSPIMEVLGDDFELIIAGNKSDLPAELTGMGNVTILGRVNSRDEMRRLYQDSDALLFPTRLEGLSLAALEAQSCGLPIITSNCSSMPEIVRHMVNGMLCPPDDVGAFAESAMTIASDIQLWRKFRIESRHMAVEQYSQSRAVENYVAIYKSLIEESV